MTVDEAVKCADRLTDGCGATESLVSLATLAAEVRRLQDEAQAWEQTALDCDDQWSIWQARALKAESALANERKRCAEIAREYGSKSVDDMARDMAEEIAAAIMEGE